MAFVNERFTVRTYPTPLVTDVIFYEVRDEVLPKNKERAYGQPHHDTINWPNHFLVYITPRQEDGKYLWYFCAKRSDQDLYNFSYSKADIGGTKFDAVVREYVILRSEFTPDTPTMGTKMPNVPEKLFGTGTGTPSVIPGYVLAERKQAKIQDQTLDSMFVVEQQVFVKKVTLGEVKFDPQTGRANDSSATLYFRGEEVTTGVTIESLMDDSTNGYWGLQANGSFQSGQALTANWFVIKTDSVIPSNPVNSVTNPAKQRRVERVTPTGTDLIFSEVGTMPNPKPDYGSAHYDATNFAGYKLAYIAPEDPSGLMFTFFYVKARAGEDAYNFEFTKADIGGTKFDAVSRNYVTLRSAFTPDTPTMGATMADVPAGKFSDFASFVLAERKQQKTNDPKIDNLFIIDQQVFVKRAALIRNDFDEALGGNLQTTQRLYYRGESVSGLGTPQTLTIELTGSNTQGVAASQILTITEIPAEGETITINSVVFTFKAVPVDETDVQIGTTLRNTQRALIAAISNSSCGGFLGKFSSGSATYTHNDEGTGGNSIAISETMAGTANKWLADATTLAGGVDSSAGDVSATFTSDVLAGSPQVVTASLLWDDTPSIAANKISAALGAVAEIYALALPSVHGAKVKLTYRSNGDPGDSASLSFEGGSTGIITLSSDSTAGTNGTDTIENLFADRSNRFWALQGDFTEREGVQLTDNWFAVTFKQVVPSDFALSGRSYSTSHDYFWPAVLGNIQIDIWNRRAGGSDDIASPIYEKDAFRGACRALVTQKFFLAPQGTLSPDALQPLPIDLHTPVFGLNIGPTLHTARSVSLSTGTLHPIYEYTAGTWYFKATKPTAWPGSVIASDEQAPFRGGYMRTTVLVYPPP